MKPSQIRNQLTVCKAIKEKNVKVPRADFWQHVLKENQAAVTACVDAVMSVCVSVSVCPHSCLSQVIIVQ